jgi:hypothetical protein
MLIKLALDLVVDAVTEVAKEKAAESDNDLDDRWVEQLENNKQLIKDSVKKKRG